MNYTNPDGNADFLGGITRVPRLDTATRAALTAQESTGRSFRTLPGSRRCADDEHRSGVIRHHSGDFCADRLYQRSRLQVVDKWATGWKFRRRADSSG
jgi:demethoxyubiquinone hydroxylase (CLK1/Coq7/Cat5 family)